MKHEVGTEFRCDECRKNITGKKHIRILMSHTSGWMLPPFLGGKPMEAVCDRNPEYHFCRTECFTLFFSKKLNEICPNTTRDARKTHGTSDIRDVLEEVGSGRSRMRRETDVGARHPSRGEESERGLGVGSAVRVFAFSRPIPGRRDIEQEYQSLDRVIEDNGLGGSRIQVPSYHMEARSKISSISLWSIITSAKRGIRSVMP